MEQAEDSSKPSADLETSNDSLVTSTVCDDTNAEITISENSDVIEENEGTETIHNKNGEICSADLLVTDKVTDKKGDSDNIGIDSVSIGLNVAAKCTDNENEIENIIHKEKGQIDNNQSSCNNIYCKVQESTGSCPDTTSVVSSNTETDEVEKEQTSVTESIAPDKLQLNIENISKISPDSSSDNLKSSSCRATNDIHKIEANKFNDYDVNNISTTERVDIKVEDDKDITDANRSCTSLKVDCKGALSQDTEGTLIVSIDDYDAPLNDKDRNKELEENIFENLDLHKPDERENEKHETNTDEDRKSKVDRNDEDSLLEPNSRKNKNQEQETNTVLDDDIKSKVDRNDEESLLEPNNKKTENQEQETNTVLEKDIKSKVDGNDEESLSEPKTKKTENQEQETNTVLDKNINSKVNTIVKEGFSEPTIENAPKKDKESETVDEKYNVTSNEIACTSTKPSEKEKTECNEDKLGSVITSEDQPIDNFEDKMVIDKELVQCTSTTTESNSLDIVKTEELKESISHKDEKMSSSDDLNNEKLEDSSSMKSEKLRNDGNTSGDEMGELMSEEKDMETETDVAVDEDIEKMSMDTQSADMSDDEEKGTLEDAIKSVLKKNEEFKKTLASHPSDYVNDSDENINTANETEVISLVDDDDDNAANCKKKPAAAINCINPNCMSGEDLAKPAMFVLTYFGMKRGKNQQVCAECYEMVAVHQEKLAVLLKEGKPLFDADFPSHKDVILLDSDEESFSEDESYLSDDTMDLIRNNLDDVIAETMTKYNLDHQIRESCYYLNNKLDNLEEVGKELDKSFNAVQKTLDECRKQIYKDFKNEIQELEELQLSDCEIPPMPILMSKQQNAIYNKELQKQLRKRQLERDLSSASASSQLRSIATKRVSKNTNYQYESSMQDVITVDSELRLDPPPDLPPCGVLDRRKLKVGDTVYCMKVSYFSIWVTAKVIEVIPRNTTENDPSTETYRVRFDCAKKNAVRTLTGKYIAYPEPPKVQPPVGTRVIAIFKEEDDGNETKENYYVGVIAEPPKAINRYRYLVFFDDGYTQYCPHKNILVVCSSNKNVWEDIHPEPREFICNYLTQYPERPMVKLSRGQVVKVEWNGRWWIVRVLEVDASLVKVHFDADKRTEWIYRGSTRLGPMYQELAAAKERQSGSLLRSRGFGNASYHKSDMPYVEYTRGDVDEKNEDDEKSDKTQVVPTRSVARKSTSKKPTELVISNPQYSKPLVSHIPLGEVKKRTLKDNDIIKPLRFRPHQCSRTCVTWTGYSPEAAKLHDPLMRPLIFGFQRLLASFRGKTVVMYRAPCGRTIRNPQEMLCYLQGTKSSLTIDLFDFDFWVNPLNEFKESRTFCRIEDLSYGKENVPISCVNELDHCMPQYVQYMTARQPGKDVPLNLDPDFLVCCDCEDDCENRETCSCWKLTMRGKKFVPDGDLDPLFGYQYRRLPERIATGIYECNSRCKCSATCQNRVAQQPLSFRLQLFKTLKKGWGIRCLHDIPRGSFICIYVGFLLTDQEANEGGKTYGDEYLAELDYIESVENLKEGYESEARDLSDTEYGENDSADSRMDVEYDEEGGSTDSDQGAGPRNREDIRLRLRRRMKEERDKDYKKSKGDDDAISISDEDNEPVRKPQTFNANITESEHDSKYTSVRDRYGPSESVYIMDAKTHGNIGRYLNHSCSPNVFVQNVFVDTHDLRFPWVAFFANQYISAGTELTWDYNYDVGSVPGKVMLCYCNSPNCRGRLL